MTIPNTPNSDFIRLQRFGNSDLKLLLTHLEHHTPPDRQHVGVARPRRDERPLAEERALLELCHQAAVDHHLNLTVRDEVERRADVALRDDVIACGRRTRHTKQTHGPHGRSRSVDDKIQDPEMCVWNE